MSTLMLAALIALATTGALVSLGVASFFIAWLVHDVLIERIVLLFKVQKAIINFIMCGQDARRTIMRLTRDNHRLREENAALEEEAEKLMNPQPQQLDDDTDELPIVVGEV